jgi:curved DNA-binding protein CbpA
MLETILTVPAKFPQCDDNDMHDFPTLHLPAHCSSDHLPSSTKMPSSLLKKAKLQAAFSSWQCCQYAPRKRLRRDPAASSRSYATEQYEFRDNMNWPCRRNGSFTPSPYEIFELERSAKYTKHKYYQLVKIYHPDRNGHNASDGLSHVQRLERYRLIVQAHEILSDPVKRRAYDTSGAGWGVTRMGDRHSRGFTNTEGKRYGFGPDDDSTIFQNANWEDWERWRHRYDPPAKQTFETYINPNAFASIVILLAIVSGFFMATRAGQFTGSVEERAQAFTEETARFLSSRQEHLRESEMSAPGRVAYFLEKRDPTKSGLKEGERESYRKHFASPSLQPGPDLKDKREAL